MRIVRWVFGGWEILRAIGVMFVIETRLRTEDLPGTCRDLGFDVDLASPAPPSAQAALLPRWTRRPIIASLAVTARWPSGDTCLRRCLLIGHRLRKLEPVLRIGVRRTVDGKFSAHSWLEFGGRAIDPTASEFAALGSADR